MEPKALLEKAAKSIASEIRENGLSPHAAAVKVAKEMELSPTFIKRAAEIMNVALTYHHFKSASDRSADFDIIDAEKVAADVFDPNVKTASAKDASFRQTILADDIPNFNRLIGDAGFRKVSEELAAGKDTEQTMSLPGLLDKAAAAMHGFERQIDDLQFRQAEHMEKFADEFFSLCDHFKKDAAYRLSFGELEAQAVPRFGKQAEELLDLVYSTSRCQDPRWDKKASDSRTTPELGKVSSFFAHSERYNKVKGELAAVEKQASEAEDLLKQAYATFGQKYLEEYDLTDVLVTEKQAGEKIEAPVVTDDETDPILTEVRKKIAADESVVSPEDEKAYLSPLQSASLPTTLKKQIIAFKKDKRPVTKVAKATDILSGLSSVYSDRSKPSTNVATNTPGHNLDRKLMLQEMLAVDPILSSKQPADVARAYSQMMRLAPDLSAEPEVVRAVLRSMTEAQALDPHTAGQLVDANTNFMKQKSMLAGGGTQGPK